MTPEENRDLKNAILKAKSAAENNIPVKQQRDLGLEIPTHNVPLPSRGLIYAPDSPLCDKDTIEIKAMTAKEENILMSRALVRKGTVISELIKSCLLDKDIDVSTMISGDRNALMVAIRVTGYGPQYVTRVTCPSCENQQDFMFDLNALDIKEIDLEKLQQVAPNTNKFHFTLPVSKKKVVFKFLTGKEEELILQTTEAKKKKGLANDELVTTRLIHSVVSIDDETERNFINQFVNNMLARDSRALRTHINENEPAIDMSQTFTCNSCGFEEVIPIPLGAEFLWPRDK